MVPVRSDSETLRRYRVSMSTVPQRRSIRYYRCDLTPTPGGPRHARRAPCQRLVRTCLAGPRHPARPPAGQPDAWHGICTSRGEGNPSDGREQRGERRETDDEHREVADVLAV